MSDKPSAISDEQKELPVSDPVLLFNEFNPVYTAKQTVAHRALARDDIKEVLYGGAKGGGNR